MSDKGKERVQGSGLGVLKFLCKRQNELVKKDKQIEAYAIGITAKNWGNLLDKFNASRNKAVKSDSLARALRELKKNKLLQPTEENPDAYVISPKGFEQAGLPESGTEEETPAKKTTPLLSDRSEIYTNLLCRKCNIADGYSEGDTICRHCGATLFFIDRL